MYTSQQATLNQPPKRLFSNRDLAVLIGPLLVEQMLTILVGLADSIMIASVGEAAVSGVSLVDCVMVLIIQVFAALAAGGAVVAGQYLGQKRKDWACMASHQLLWALFVLALLVMLLLYAGRWFILHVVFGQIEADVMYNANIYLLIVTASIPFIAVYDGGAAIFRAMGDSRMSMLVSLFMNIINVVGNAVLIYGFHRGTEGVAIPTLVSRMVAALLMVVLLKDQNRLLHLPRGERYHLDWGMTKKILRVGVPNGIENGMFQFGKILILALVSSFGTFAIAANAVGNVVAIFQILAGSTMSLAIITVISRCIGAGDLKQAKYYVRKMMLITYVGMWVICGLMFLALPFILDIYHLSPEATHAAKQLLTIHGICAMAIWPLAFTLPNVFRAAGDVKFSLVVSTFSMWVFRIFLSFVFGKWMGYGVVGVWIAMIVDWCVRIAFFIPHYLRGKWMKYKAV